MVLLFNRSTSLGFRRKRRKRLIIVAAVEENTIARMNESTERSTELEHEMALWRYRWSSLPIRVAYLDLPIYRPAG